MNKSVLKRTVALAAGAISGILILSACSQGGASPSASSSEAAPIKIMTIAPVETTLQNYPDAPAGAEAAVNAINAAGGINGQQLEWSFCNTESDPNKSTACARKAATEGVVAVVGMVDAFSTTSLPVLEQAGIPAIGMHSAGSEADWVNPTNYPFQGGAVTAILAASGGASELGLKRAVVLAVDVAASQNQIPLLEQAAERDGLEYAGAITVPISGVTDYAPYAQQIADANADAVFMITSAGVAGAVIKAADSLGIDATFFYNGFSYNEPEVKDLGDLAENVVVISPYPSFRDTDVPAVVEFNEQLDELDPSGDPLLRRTVGFNAWLSVWALADIIKGIDGPVTAESVTAALEESGPLRVKDVLDWNPSEQGAANPSFPRIPSAEQRFLALQDGELRTLTDIPPYPDSLAGITR